MIKAILFDFFDVIHRDHQKAWLAANGFERAAGFAEASDKLDRGEIDFEEYLRRYAQYSHKTPMAVRAEFAGFDEVDEAMVGTIGRLKRHYRTALISNAHTDELRPILENYNLERLFDEIFISSEVGIAKPDPDLFRHVLKIMAVQPKECVFVDDNPANVAAAQELGITGIVFTDASAFATQLQSLKL